MAYTSGRFGIQFQDRTRRCDDDLPRLLPLVLGLVLLAALVSLVLTCLSRARLKASDRADAEEAARAVEEVRPAPAPRAAQPLPLPAPLPADDAFRRPTRVRILLMRLRDAEKAHNVEMAASTIEELRSLPGRPAADIDDPLARRLSVLNVRRLFASDVSPWTTTVTVKRGDSASRIAREHGSTLASLEKLNGGNCDRLVVGRRLKVLNHPRFSLAVHRVTRTADLSLNGKFFKRYYLTGPVRGAVGAYETPERLHRLWAEKGISFKVADGAELEMLLPKGTPVFVAEF